MLESLGLDTELDFATLSWLGNTGSVALPITLAMACQAGFVVRQDRLAMLGIGSGINCLMLGAQWQESRIGGTMPQDIAIECGGGAAVRS